MIKKIVSDIDQFLESKVFILLILCILILVLIPITLSLAYSNDKLEEQIIERDNHIRSLQYTDSIARQFLDIEVKDSVQVFSYIQVDGKVLSYKDLLEESKKEHKQLEEAINENIKLHKEVEKYKVLIDLAQKTYQFKYSITEKNDSIHVNVWKE